MIIRRPAVAGLFYPEDPDELRAEIRSYLDAAPDGEAPPKGLIAPHAGTVYSGPIAATAYATLKKGRDQIRRVVLLGPAHRVAFHGLAASRAEFFETPLGKIPVDREALSMLSGLRQVIPLDEAHEGEHSLELQLPFLQEVLERFSLVPLVVGETEAMEVAQVLERLWGGGETLLVISSDLSHYHSYERARLLDRDAAERIEKCDWEGLKEDQACGFFPVRGFLMEAGRRHLKGKVLDLRNSGDTAGDKTRVVGYGAFYFS